MLDLRRVGISVAALVLVGGALPSRAVGGPRYNCKNDKAVDVPIQFVFDIQSAGRVHLSGYGGSDKSGLIYPMGWTLFDASGRQVDNYPKAIPVWTSSNMLKEANLEGLVAGASYSVALTSQDWCGNLGVVKKTLNMPTASAEVNSPVLSTPSTIQSGLMGYLFTQISFSVTDDSSVQNLTVSIDGTVVSSFTYGQGTSFRWWLDDYPFDSTKSTLEGPNYYVNIPENFKGGVHLVEVVAVDMYGNQTVTSAVLPL